MTEQQPIIVPSRSPSPELSPYSTPATSREPSPDVDVWPQGPATWPDLEALPFQEQLDLWTASTNPRPTSEEVRTFIREVGLIFKLSLRKDRDDSQCLHKRCNEVSDPVSHNPGCC